MFKEYEKPVELRCKSIYLDGFTCGQVYYSYKYDIEAGIFKVYNDYDNVYILSRAFIAEYFDIEFPKEQEKSEKKISMNELYISNAHIYFKNKSENAEEVYRELKDICFKNGIVIGLDGEAILRNSEDEDIDSYCE